ncbi:MAG: hypothetical protein ACI4EI_11820 [Muricoprocola sp.]
MTENIELMMPIKATPYDHQKKAFAFACDKFGVFDNRLKSRGAALLMEMGTGKTIVSIAVAGCMYQYGNGKGTKNSKSKTTADRKPKVRHADLADSPGTGW